MRQPSGHIYLQQQPQRNLPHWTRFAKDYMAEASAVQSSADIMLCLCLVADCLVLLPTVFSFGASTSSTLSLHHFSAPHPASTCEAAHPVQMRQDLWSRCVHAAARWTTRDWRQRARAVAVHFRCRRLGRGCSCGVGNRLSMQREASEYAATEATTLTSSATSTARATRCLASAAALKRVRRVPRVPSECRVT
jgi:hypothetical protein